MKAKLGLILRVLVSVGILAYLFHGIFLKEVAETADQIASSPTVSVADLAQELHLSPAQVELVRTQCVADNKADLSKLAFRDRVALVWDVGPRGLWDVFQQTSLLWFVLGTGCMGVVSICGIIRWRWILRVQGLELSFSRATSIFFVGMFFNAFMLGSTGGDVIKAWYVAHETHHKKAEAIATVVVDRVIGLIVLFVIALIMMGIYYHRVFDDVKLRWFAVVTLAVVVATVGGTALTLWRGFADKCFGLRRWLERLPQYDSLCRMVEACRVYVSHPTVLGKTVLITVGVHVFSMLSIVCIGQGMKIVTQGGMVDYFLYLPIINSVSAIPVSISGFGVREGMYQVMFGTVGVVASQAVALSLLGYLACLFWSLVGSFFYLTHRKELPTAKEMVTAQ